MNRLVATASLLVWLAGATCPADEFHVAVASNFATTMDTLATAFEKATGHRAIVSVGSTGKLYAQIIHGAPFDAFFAADADRPARLEQLGRTTPDSRFTYCLGRLVLWCPTSDRGPLDEQSLAADWFRHLAIANPDLAPYGAAARSVLEGLGQWEALQPRIVRGENIGQAFQFVASGNAELGFVAMSQVRTHTGADNGTTWQVPDTLHQPIVQQAVLLSESKAAGAFLDFVRSDAALQLIRDSGYNVP